MEVQTIVVYREASGKCFTREDVACMLESLVEVLRTPAVNDPPYPTHPSAEKHMMFDDDNSFEITCVVKKFETRTRTVLRQKTES